MTTRRTKKKTPKKAVRRKSTVRKKTTLKKAAQKSNVKHLGGRPTKYSNETLKIAREYLKNYARHGDKIPSVAGLAVVLAVRRETLHVWAKEEGKEEFSNILGDILAKQENILVNKGLSGDFNPTIVKLVLGKHGYHEKRETEVSGKDGKPIKTEHVSRDLSNLDPKEAERVYNEFASSD